MTRIRSIVLLCALAACSPPDDQETGSVGREQMQKAQRALDPAVALRLDSANAAFRRDDFTTAARLYREAARIDRDASAAWFGIYMAETALENPAAADSALRRVQQLQPGASLVHPDVGDARGVEGKPHP